MSSNLIHRFGATAGGTPVNAYIIEAPTGAIVIDSTLAVSSARALRAAVQALGKPLLGVVVTHAHPDHYGGLVELVRDVDVPAFSTEAVANVIRRDDPIKEQILRPMFGDEWAAERAFPDRVVTDGETVSLGGVRLSVTDLGPGESPADSVWRLDGDGRQLFIGDLAYDRMHCFLADGFHQEWLANLERGRAEMPQGATLHPGHGEPCGLEVLDWQAGYINAFLDAVRAADWNDADAASRAVVSRMREHLPAGELEFLMELSIDPVAEQLGLR
jgi:glyoxylase-like metal-dependent hydrolase (beta-lactamase superfamily II)